MCIKLQVLQIFVVCRDAQGREGSIVTAVAKCCKWVEDFTPETTTYCRAVRRPRAWPNTFQEHFGLVSAFAPCFDTPDLTALNM